MTRTFERLIRLFRAVEPWLLFARFRTLCFSALLLTIAHTAVAGEIALSFDDAPLGDGAFLTGAERTDMLIRKLDSLGVAEVVFYCTTEKIQGPVCRKRLQDYSAAGHKLGNHSYSHPHPHWWGASKYLADIDRAHKELVQYEGFVPWFRYPFLDEGATPALRDSIRAALAERDYINGYVTVDNYEWYMDRLTRLAVDSGRTVDLERLRGVYVDLLWQGILFYDDIAQRTLERSPKHVLLLHENDLAALFIDSLVTHIRAQGWSIITPTEAYTDPIADSLPDVIVNNQGRVAALAWARHTAPHGFQHPSEDMGYLDSLFQVREIIRDQ